MNQWNGIKIAGEDVSEALSNDFSWQDARVGLRSRPMKRDERRALKGIHWRNGRDVVWWCPLTRIPERLVLSSNRLASPFANSFGVAEFRVKHALQFPVT